MNLVTAHIQFQGMVAAEMVFPENLQACVGKVLGGEYKFPLIPDAPQIRRILDVGANVGAFAVWAYMQFPNVWIDCFEPNPGAATLCERNAPPGTKVHNVAVTIEDEPRLHLGGDWGWSSTKDGLNQYAEESIPVNRIHPKDLPPCDLLKIDAEGCEPEIVNEYQHWSAVQICMFEWHNEHDRIWIERSLSDVGLRCIRLQFDRVNLGQEIWMRTRCRWDERTGRYVL